MTEDQSSRCAGGFLGFPQDDATVLCHTDLLRFSVCSNTDFLSAQAVLWAVSRPFIGKTRDNRDVGNHSTLLLDVDADCQQTPDVDRRYSLDPWPHKPGLHYQVVLSESSTTGLRDDSAGHGCIRYLDTPDGQTVRVDTYLIPLSEIGSAVGDCIRMCYWASSPSPPLTVDSVGHAPPESVYYAHSIPLAAYHQLELASGACIDMEALPDDRGTAPEPVATAQPMPTVGQSAPPFCADDWLNVDGELSLEALHGQVVLLDFWATWCGACLVNITHLNQLHRRFRDSGLRIVSLAPELSDYLQTYVDKHEIAYPVGANSPTFAQYGIQAIPYTFLIDRQGRIAWHGSPDPAELEGQIALVLAADSDSGHQSDEDNT